MVKDGWLKKRDEEEKGGDGENIVEKRRGMRVM